MPVSRTTGSPNAPRYLAAAAWLLVFVLVVVLSHRWLGRSFRVYQAAGGHWLHQQPLYDTRTIEGFQYFPQAAMLMAPFAWLGQPLGGLAWRALWWTLYGAGMARVVTRVAPQQAPIGFLIASALAVGSGTGALSNGQANLAVAGLLLHATAELVDERWWRATAVLAFGVALKPLMAVPLLLAWAVYPRLRWRLPLALVVALVAPWLTARHVYVVDQYRACVIKLRVASDPGGLYEDLRGLLASAGWRIPHFTYVVVRMVAAVATVAVSMRARRLGPAQAAVVIAGLAAGYLMLFNPRTQSTSYVIAAAPAAVLAAAHLLERRRANAAPLMAVVLVWMVSYHDVAAIQFWLKPLGAIVFLASLLHVIWRPPATWVAATPIVDGVGSVDG